ncbi:phosphoheptose isomerase [bacterium]|nr:phosphoheptose isomerase [bacterium]|tara:strand:- start:381 stop:959 length:579 start_codon:yes stop_codon:yes gene_type:complete
MKDIFAKHSAELHEVTKNLDGFHDQVLAVVRQLKEAYSKGNKVLIAGNGGSAAEAQHFSDEMVGKYKADRRPYPAIALTADSAVLTCIGNDWGYEDVFARQVTALGNEGDIFIGLTTSGSSKNILKAANAARDAGMTVIAFTGPSGPLTELADYAIESPSETGARIQELHLHAIHLLCEAFEPENLGDEDAA